MKKYSFQSIMIFTLFTLSIFSCGAPTKYSINSDQLNNVNSGIVLGKITKQRFYGLFMYELDGYGRGFGIKNKETGESFTYTGAHYFEMRLPKGVYQLKSMGTPNGAIIPRTEPFEFKVNNGEIKYIGSIVADRDLRKHLEKIGVENSSLSQHIFSIKDYGEIETSGFLQKPTGKARKPFFTFYVIDERDEIIKRFKEKYHNIDVKNINVEFMK